MSEKDIYAALDRMVKEGKLVKRWNEVKKEWYWQAPPKLTE